MITAGLNARHQPSPRKRSANGGNSFLPAIRRNAASRSPNTPALPVSVLAAHHKKASPNRNPGDATHGFHTR
jgi:hypothetical protein